MNRFLRIQYVGTLSLLGSCFILIDNAHAFEELLRRIPDTANAIVALDVESIFRSELAKSEDWKSRYSDKFATTPLRLPPTARRFLLGAELDVESMQPQWEVASMELSTQPTANEILKVTGGVLDSVAGKDIIWPQAGTCIAKFSDSGIGILSPANRNTAARWIQRSDDATSDNFSPYLRQAIKYAAGAGPEIVMAIDLEHLIRPEEVRAAVDRADIVGELDPEDVTDVLASFRGVTLGVRVAERIDGKLIVDFGNDATLLEPVAKELILNILANAGATLDELSEWTQQVDGKRISLKGPLTTVGMRRLFSLVDLDSAIVHRKVTKPTPEGSFTKKMMGQTSLRYFRAITGYLNDVQRPNRQKDTLAGKGLWATNYARKIASLRTYGVDPDLINYAEQVVYLMRDAVAHIHGTIRQIDERFAGVNPVTGVQVTAVPPWRVRTYGFRYRPYAPMVTANIDIAGATQEREAIAQEGTDRLAAEAEKIMNQLHSETDAIRQVMSDRYGLEF